jgi:phenylacetate-CoA ligase
MTTVAISRSPYTRFVSGCLFPLHERLKGHDSVARLHALEVSQWWDRAQLQAHRLDGLRQLLCHAATQVPYYGDLFQTRGFLPERVDTLAALRDLPFLTKALIREHRDRLISASSGKLVSMATGGSSGEPLRFLAGPARISHDVAAKWRATRWWGVDIGDPEIVIWGSPIEISTQDRVRALRDRLLRSRLLSAFSLDEQTLDRMLRLLRRQRPAMLFGYPSALARLCAHARQRNLRLDDLGIRVAFVTSELLYDAQRALITQVLGCPVANGYGGRDAGFIAHECPAGGMHISAEDIIVETVDAEGQPTAPGVAGEIVVTHLATTDFPFIRYRTGDVGVLDDSVCACGRGLPLLRELQGRSTDFVRASDGTPMHGLALIYILREIPGLQTFKIVQESLRLTRVLLVTEPGFASDSLATIRSGFQQRLGRDVAIDIEEVADIPAERSGKYRYVVSRVSDT